VAVAVTLFAGKALAQDLTVVEKLVQMNQKALGDYDTFQFESAKKTLLEALLIGKKASLGNHPLMARTYVNLGAVFLTGFKNRDKAIVSCSRALEIDPLVGLSRGTATPQMNEAFAEAKRGRTPPKKAPPPVSTAADDSDEKDLPVRIQALDCPNEDEAIIDRPVTLRCAVAPNLPVATVWLMYHEPGKETYTALRMTRSPKGWYVGKIPKRAVTGKSISFYFEGRNAAGKAVVRNGDEPSPNILLLMDDDAYREMKRARTRGREWDLESPLN
jgi:hypothetical protein